MRRGEAMSDKARILTFGFAEREHEQIDRRLAEIGVPPPTRLEKQHGSTVIGDILRDGAVGTEEFDCQERLVLFYNLSEGGVRSLMQVFKALEIPKPIFAVVTETSITWTLEQLMEHLIEEKRAHESST
jgi:hypothetical protein